MSLLVLASGSSYRASLLRKLKLDFIICSSQVDESIFPDESAEQLVNRLAYTKAHALRAAYPEHLIIGSDQVAVCNNIFLNKPNNKLNAIAQLKSQSGQIVQFYTGICVLNSATGQSKTDIDICNVHFKTLTESQIEHYIELDEPYDCAGSFKSEGLGVTLFKRIDAQDPNALVGLPLIKLIGLLEKFGVFIL